MNPDTVHTFVTDLRYHLETKGEKPLSCCVDGRMVESDEMAPAARPGADAGDFMAVCAALRTLGVENIQNLYPSIFDAVVSVAGGPERFRFHSDGHVIANPDGESVETIGRGCGHLSQAEKYPRAYGLEAADMEVIFGFLFRLLRSGAREVILEGKHTENAVIIVESDKFAVRHGDDDGRQAFVYHAILDRARLKELAHELASKADMQKKGLSEDKLLAAICSASDIQRQETLVRLARELPVYIATDDDVRLAGYVGE